VSGRSSFRELGVGIEAPPAAPAEGIVDIHAELTKAAVGDGLDHAWEPGFGRGIELPLAQARVSDAVGAGFPGLRPVEHDDADAADGAEMIEAPGEDFGVDGTAIRFGVESGSAEGDDFASDDSSGRSRAGLAADAIENDYAKVGPTTACKIDREHGHGDEGTASRRNGQCVLQRGIEANMRFGKGTETGWVAAGGGRLLETM